MEQSQSSLAVNGSKRFLCILSKNSFLFFTLFTKNPLEKLCLPNWSTALLIVIFTILVYWLLYSQYWFLINENKSRWICSSPSGICIPSPNLDSSIWTWDIQWEKLLLRICFYNASVISYSHKLWRVKEFLNISFLK